MIEETNPESDKLNIEDLVMGVKFGKDKKMQVFINAGQTRGALLIALGELQVKVQRILIEKDIARELSEKPNLIVPNKQPFYKGIN